MDLIPVLRGGALTFRYPTKVWDFLIQNMTMIYGYKYLFYATHMITLVLM